VHPRTQSYRPSTRSPPRATGTTPSAAWRETSSSRVDRRARPVDPCSVTTSLHFDRPGSLHGFVADGGPSLCRLDPRPLAGVSLSLELAASLDVQAAAPAVR